ncbi:SDR family oxidoreductase [Rhodocaloribacter sp.]
MSDATDLRGQAVLLTGASRGLGRHTALRLARAGMRLALCARDRSDLEGVAREVEALGGEALVCPLDVRDAERIDAAVARTLDAFGRIDVLINNAGLGWYKPFTEWTREEIDTALDVNLRGLIHLTHAVLPYMLERGRGYVVNVASDVGRRVIPNMAAYVAAKHGVVGFSGALLREVKDRGIRVSVLLPGIIDTYFGGGEEGARDPSWSMHPADVAEVIHTLLRQPPGLVLDEVTLHPLGQDF